MKLKSVLFANLLCVTAMAQRDYKLTESRNAWLTSNNAAALTTLRDSTIATGKLFYVHDSGRLRTASEGSMQNTYGADVRSYCRLSEELVAYGSVTYTNFHGTEMAGSMLSPTTELMPFDIAELTSENAGSKQRETFRLTGAIGWDAGECFAIGAKADFQAGSYAKHRDLRHSNTLMDVSASATVLYKPWGIGVGFLYRRSTETLSFKTYGTTDKVYQTLIDYANRFGEVETFGGDGFTDDSREQPLFSDYLGAMGQWAWKGIFVDVAWRHRNGSYGKQSQYTASHSKHRGDSFSARLRYDLTGQGARLWWVDMTMDTEKLTSHRTNYRRVASPDNPTLVYYEYYEPTKIADKVQTNAAMDVTGYWKPAGEIYLWHFNGGLAFRTDKRTAYKYPETNTAKSHCLAPFATLRRGFLFHDTSLLTAQMGCSMTFGSVERLAAQAKVAYEIPVPKSTLRPSLALRYDYVTATGGMMKGFARHSLAVSVEVVF